MIDDNLAKLDQKSLSPKPNRFLNPLIDYSTMHRRHSSVKKGIRPSINKSGVPLILSDVDEKHMKNFILKISEANRSPNQVKRLSYYD